MHRLSALFLCLILALSLGLGSAARATEGDPCIEVAAAAAAELGHSVGDADQVPADGGKGYPHHHGGCHGHCVGVPVTTDAVTPFSAASMVPLAFDQRRLARGVADPALRPPQA
jgi:hypothetical protein